jgi:hypothetical protein
MDGSTLLQEKFEYTEKIFANCNKYFARITIESDFIQYIQRRILVHYKLRELKEMGCFEHELKMHHVPS